ncbi:MAG: V-type ATP synthase subunit D [Elusimicrobiota bacterium]|nr:V-type ATP synthase subunit D [Elusimicrobiota bacterium]
MRLQVNPNRMELLRLKKRLVFAYRGHKLLKDKQEELTRNFMKLVSLTKSLREEIEKKLLEIQKLVIDALMIIPTSILEYAIAVQRKPEIHSEVVSMMNLKLVKFHAELPKAEFLFYYPVEINLSIQKFFGIVKDIFKLAELEKSVELIAYELQRTRRRVNALEYVLIPSLKETIRSITDRLNELERANITRLMKIKELVGEK